MAQLATPFPEALSRGFTGGPVWRSEITETGSGYEYVNKGWSQPRHSFVAGRDACTEAFLGGIRAHFMVASGMAHTFPFKDWSDYRCPDYSGAGVFVMLTSTTFQFHKRYTSGANYFDRKIVIPKNGTIAVTGGALASINYATGVATMTSGTPTSWTGDFYNLCRYGEDAMKSVLIDGPTEHRVVGWSGITIEEIRA